MSSHLNVGFKHLSVTSHLSVILTSPDIFNSMQFSGKNGQIIGWRHPPPPLGNSRSISDTNSSPRLRQTHTTGVSEHTGPKEFSPIIWPNKSSTQHLISSGPFSLFVWNVSPLDSGLSALEENPLGRIRCWVWTRDWNPMRIGLQGTEAWFSLQKHLVANQWSRVKHCEDEVSGKNPTDYQMD